MRGIINQYANPPEKIKTRGGIVFSRQLFYQVQMMSEKSKLSIDVIIETVVR
jgi:hypothetical protein